MSASAALAQEQAQLVLDVATAGEADARGERLGPMREGQLRAGDVRRFPVRIPGSRCLLFVARGGAGIQNLDVAVQRGQTLVARDHDTGARASARHCAGDRAESVQLVVRAFTGAGRFAAAAYTVPGEPSTAGHAEAQGERPLERLDALAVTSTEGFVAVTPAAQEDLTSDARLERDVPLQAGRCYRVLAAGDARIGNLDIAVLTADGSTLQDDGTEHATPTLGVLRPLCPPTTATYRVRIESRGDAGSVAWRVYGAGSTAMPAAAPERTFEVGGAGRSFLAEGIRRAHSRAGRGWRAMSDRMESRHERSEAKELPFEVSGGFCYVAIAAGEPSARQVSLQVLDQYGQERGRAAPDAQPAASFCATIGGTYRIRVKVELGYGNVAVQTFGAPR